MLHLGIRARRLDHIRIVDDLVQCRHVRPADRMPPDCLRNRRIVHAVDLVDQIGTYIGMEEERHGRLDFSDGNPAPASLCRKFRSSVYASAVMQEPRNVCTFLIHAEAACQRGSRIRNAEGVLIAAWGQLLFQNDTHLLIALCHTHDTAPVSQYTLLRHAAQDGGWTVPHGCVRE